MRVEWESHSFPSYTVVCNESPEALCRAQFDCDCEEYAAIGIGGDGKPWHALADGYLTEEERNLPEPPRHHGEHGGECNYALWLNNGDCTDDLGHGTADLPATFTWDGDGYEWDIAGGAS